MPIEELLDEGEGGVVLGTDAEENLNGAWVGLVQPRLEGFGGAGIRAGDGFEDGDRGKGCADLRGALVQGKAHGRNPLPDHEGGTEEGEACKGGGQH